MAAAKPDKLAALLAKLKEGKRLTKAEETFVEQSKAEARFVPTLKEVASHFGVTINALYKWRREGDEETFAGGPKGYDIEAFTAVRKRFVGSGKNPRLLQSDVTAEGTEGKETDVTALKARKIRLECDKLATQIDILRGKYALVEDVLAEVRTVIYAVKDRIRRAGPELAYEVSGVTPAEAEERINAYTHQVLTDLETTNYEQLEEKLKKPNEIGEHIGHVPAARETNGRQK